MSPMLTTNEKTERNIEVKKSNGASHRTMKMEVLEIMIIEVATASVQGENGGEGKESKGKNKSGEEPAVAAGIALYLWSVAQADRMPLKQSLWIRLG